MANVMFKRGLQANLPSSGIVDGSFYLTTDTNRLYIGNGSSLVELNKSITVVDTVAELPKSGVEVGQFYYVKGPDSNAQGTHNGNILAVVTGFDANHEPTWVQVNPDTDTKDNDHLGSVSVTKGSESGGIIPYTLTFQMVDRAGVNKTGTQPSVTINVDASDIIDLIDANVSTSAVTNGVATVTTKIKNIRTNDLSTGGSFALKAGSNVTLTRNNDGQIEISTGIGSGSVQLAVDGATDNQVTANVQVNGANSGSTLTLTGDRGIDIDYASNITKIGHANSVANGTDGGSTETATTLRNGGNFTAVIESKYDAYGHVTSQKKQTITLPTISANEINVDSTDKSKLTFSVKDQNGTASTAATSGSILFHKITVDGVESTVKNQDSLGSFYSADEIDAKMRQLDALTYKGTVASSSDIPVAADGVQIGDTYKVSAANSGITIGGVSAKLGDLIIATGTEDTDGNITAATLQWTLVAGGTDDDTTYKTKVASGGTNIANVGIIASTANGNFSQYTAFSGDAVINITATAGEDSAGAVAFEHANSGVTAGSYGENTAGSISAGGTIKIPSVTVNAKGHVTAASETSITLPGNNKLGGTAADKKVELQTSTGTALGSITFANGNLTTTAVTINGVNETVTVNHAVPTMGTDATPTASKNISSATDSDRQIVAISGITKDTYGHVTQIDTTTYTIGRIDDQLVRTVSSTTAGATTIDSVTITSDLQTYAGVSKGTSAFTLKSPEKTISITNTANTGDINIDIVWGTF